MDANYYDFLTGLPNMTYFFEVSGARKATISKNFGQPAVLFIVLHGLKGFNQKQGFTEGNNFLQSFASLLSQYFDKENCCRLGGGHFAVIADATNIEKTLQNLIESCRNLYTGGGIYLHIGIYSFLNEDVNINIACDRAKLACDTLENNREAGFAHYNLQIKHEEENHRYIIENLNKAISERWITVYYQPIVRAVNGKVCDEEALARWIDPVKGFLSPADFIPVLEEEKLIYKLDLYMLERVIEKMKYLESQNIPILPQSINLSRSDFDSCDIVEEIRTRVDLAGIPRSKISIEITESTIGSDFDFMMKQILRFKELGFPIWMDDFGSGYSSLNVLKEIPFDLIKFDMSFMRQFEAKNNGKIILAELIKMAFSIGVDTVCEGVETEEQIQFLREVGCSKIQGYYYGKPIPFEGVVDEIHDEDSMGYENPAETRYYETVGRVNLQDLTAITYGNEKDFNNVFNMVPMAVLEIKDETVRFVRTNQSYRNFFKRFFGVAVSNKEIPVSKVLQTGGASFIRVINQVSKDGNRTFIDEILPDGSVANYFSRKLSENPVTKSISVAVAVLSIKDSSKESIYTNIANALATDYFKLFYLDLETEEFIEYSSGADEKFVSAEKHGEHFFEQIHGYIKNYMPAEDRETFLKAFTKENLLKDLGENGKFSKICRFLDGETPYHANIKVMRMYENLNHVVIALSNIESQVKQRRMLEKAQQEQIIFSRLMALSGDFVCMYIVDPKTEEFSEYNASTDYKKLKVPQIGTDFFATSHKNAERTLLNEDVEYFKKYFTKENLLSEINANGICTLHYHLILNGKTQPVTTKAALVKEGGRDKLIIGIRV